VLANRWHAAAEFSRAGRRVYGASDASDEACGWTWFCDFWTKNDFTAVSDWVTHSTVEHIFLREMRAVWFAVRSALCDADGVPTLIFLCIDATAVRHALIRGYSTNAVAEAMNAQLHSFLSDSQSRLVTIGIRGPDNMADDPSHLRDACLARRPVPAAAPAVGASCKGRTAPDAMTAATWGKSRPSDHYRRRSGRDFLRRLCRHPVRVPEVVSAVRPHDAHAARTTAGAGGRDGRAGGQRVVAADQRGLNEKRLSTDAQKPISDFFFTYAGCQNCTASRLLYRC
jgi:hypothetical protein